MYKELTHKEIIEDLNNSDNYEAAWLIKDLKKQVKNLKRKNTLLKKLTQP